MRDPAELQRTLAGSFVWSDQPQASVGIRTGLFEVEVSARPCKYPCQLGHTHDWPVENQVLDGGALLGDQGVNVSLPRGATAQNNYRAVLRDDSVVYQCGRCQEILTAVQIDGHICPDILAMMEDEDE